MALDIQKFGDPFEQVAFKRFPEKLQRYPEFWELYVGNDNGRPMEIDGLSKEQNRKRLLIAQWNYGILRNILNLDEIFQKCKNSKVIKNDVTSLIQHEQWFVSSINLFYNNSELFDKVKFHVYPEELNTNKDHLFKDFRKMRAAIIHNLKPVLKISEEDFYLVPKNFDWFLREENTFKKENNKRDDFNTWIWCQHDFSELEYQRLPDFVSWGIEKSFFQFQRFLGKELEFFEIDFIGKLITVTIPISISSNEQTSDIKLNS
jgi:hypothetical protein